MLRVIAGELGGRRLHTPSGLTTRPTADRVREALFNILGPPPENAAALDLFAGSGALGIEALSRGIARAVFVEKDAATCKILANNLALLGLASRAQVLPVAVKSARVVAPPGGFAWIFADPPYKSDEVPALLSWISSSSLLAEGGQLVIERAARDACALAEVPPPGRLVFCDRRRYGDTALLFYSLIGEAS